jgi:glycosyltransferase involved in cell wall biosynthesis
MVKKILHLRSSGGLLGAENVIIEICKHAKENGYISIIGAINDSKDPYPDFLITAKSLDIPTELFTSRNQIDPTCAFQIRNYIVENKINIVHAHGYKEDFFTLASHVKIPKIATNHLWKRNNLKSKLYCLIDSYLLKMFDRVIGVSDEIVKELNQRKIKNVTKISNGIDVGRFSGISRAFELYSKFNLDHKKITLGMISSITPEKGHFYAIKAFSRLVSKCSNVQMIIIGEGNQYDLMKSLVSELKLESNIFFGGKQTAIPQLLSIIDIFVLSSLAEGLPMALLEAMASKKAIVATAVGEVPNVIENKVNGVLVQPKEIESLSLEIEELLFNERLRQQYGKNAFATVNLKYSSKRMAEEYYKTYSLLLK